MRRFVSELLSYVNTDLFERNAARFLPPFSRRALFKKPKNWGEVFLVKPHEPPNLHEDLDLAIEAAQEWLLAQQDPQEGFWCAPLRADTTLESDMVMLWHFLGWQDQEPYRTKIPKMARWILSQQQPDGGWNIYRHGPSEISATVKAYWALKLAGVDPAVEPLQRARACIERQGGIHKVNSYSKFYMALFGLYDWRGVPAIPPELMVFPSWFYFNIYEMSAWTRGIVIPLSIVWAVKPRRDPPAHGRLDELFPDGQPHWTPVVVHPAPGEQLFSWRRFFLWWDRGLKWLEGKGPHWVRVKALQRAEAWMRQRFEHSGGLGAIFPPMVNAVLAMKALGYADDHPWIRHHMEELARLEIEHEDALEVQPCFSPVWDTAISSLALAESGLPPDHPALIRAATWLIQKEIRIPGDWQVKNATGPVGGWFFEFDNAFYPDTDDTAMVLLALRRGYLEGPLAQEREKAYLRGLNWLLSMQSANGGWGAFDINNTKAIFEKIPFADHNAMIDPPTSDITGRVLELLGQVGYDRSYRPVQRALEFLKREQEPDGSWYGRWGVNYLYGTWQVLRGLTSVGEDIRDPAIQRPLQWFRSVQQPDGGWGETCATYDDPTQKGQGPSTPSQTAWALMAFLTCGIVDDLAVKQGLEYLLSTQLPDGTWDEEEFTGTGFPKVFYLEYTYYRHYFPLLALGMYRRQRQRFSRERRIVTNAVT